MVITTLRVLLCKQEVGRLIGINGDTIKKLRDETKAKIHISKGTLVQRVVSISGDVDDMVQALGQIATTLCHQTSKYAKLKLLLQDDFCKYLGWDISICILNMSQSKTW